MEGKKNKFHIVVVGVFLFKEGSGCGGINVLLGRATRGPGWAQVSFCVEMVPSSLLYVLSALTTSLHYGLLQLVDIPHGCETAV